MNQFSDALEQLLSQAPENLRDDISAFLSLSREEQAEDIARGLNAEVGSLKDYDCPACLNKGRIYTAEGGVVRDYQCSCMKIRQTLRKIKKSGMASSMDTLTLAAFHAESDWQKRMKDTAEAYLLDLGRWLFIGGQSGCGKTHLATAILGYCIRSLGMSARLMSWVADSTNLKSLVTFPLDYTAAVTDFQQTEVLYIDDFLKNKPTEADVRLAREILDYRYMNSLPTIITSERYLTEITEIDESISGRIGEMAGKKYILNIRRDRARNYRFRGLDQLI